MVEKGKAWLFVNQYHEEGDKKPTKTGNGEIGKDALRRIIEAMKISTDGLVKLDCAVWDNETKDGGKPYEFLTFDVQDPKYAKDNTPGSSDSGDNGSDAWDDDIPF